MGCFFWGTGFAGIVLLFFSIDCLICLFFANATAEQENPRFDFQIGQSFIGFLLNENFLQKNNRLKKEH